MVAFSVVSFHLSPTLVARPVVSERKAAPRRWRPNGATRLELVTELCPRLVSAKLQLRRNRTYRTRRKFLSDAP